MQPLPPLQPTAPRLLLPALCVGAFIATCTGPSLSPFLLDIARDLDSEFATIANMVTLINVTWGSMAFVGGFASDRIGRRPVLIGGLTLLGIALIACSRAPSVLALGATELLCGMGGGFYMGTVFATAADGVPANRRGQALGWVVTGQSLAVVLGVPIITLIGAYSDWRGAILAQGAATLAVAAIVTLVVPRQTAAAHSSSAQRTTLRAIMRPRLVGLIVGSLTDRMCFVATTIYLPTFLILSYGVPKAELAIALMLVATGNVVGNLVGSYLTDRVPSRVALFGFSSLGAGLFAAPLLGWPAGLAISLALGMGYALFNSTGRPALLAALTEVPADVRGTLLGLNMSVASLGWITTVIGGSWLITTWGFGGLAAFAAGAGLLGATVAASMHFSSRMAPESAGSTRPNALPSRHSAGQSARDGGVR
jgi:DHA1 family inner membrane transport protein